MTLSNIKNIVELIQEAEAEGLLVDNKVLSGFSGEKLIGLLQRL